MDTETLIAVNATRDAQLADNDQQWKSKVDLLQAQLSDNDEQWKAKLAAERDWSQHLRIQLAAEVEKVNKLQLRLAELKV